MPLAEKIITREGCDIHYWVSQKDGTPWLIFLHGAGADHRMFNDQIPAVEDKFSLLLWDARGHGLSRPMGKNFSIRLLVDDLICIMQKEGIRKGTLIGQSMGGNIAQEAVFCHPDIAEGLVLIDCTRNTQHISWIEKALLKTVPIIMPLYPWKPLIKKSAELSAVRANVRNYLIDAFSTVGKRDFSRILIETTACLHYEKDYKINKPILLVCGEHDNTGNIKKIASAWCEQEPFCQFHMIKDAGHCSNQDNPGMFNKLLVDFLNG